MKTSVQLLPQPVRLIVIEEDTNKLIKAYDECWEQRKNEIELEGFDSGQVPRVIAEKKIPLQELYKPVLNNIIHQAILSSNKKVWEITDVAVEWQTEKSPLIIYVTSFLHPEVISCDYKDIKIPIKTLQVTEAEINTILTKIALSESQDIPWSISSPKEATRYIVDFMISLPSGKNVGTQKNYKCASHNNLYGFETHLETHPENEPFSIEVVLDKNFFNKQLAGQKVKYDIRIIKKIETKVPPIDDQLAIQLDFVSLEDMKSKIANDLEKDKKKVNQALIRDQLMSVLVSKSVCDPIPESFMKKELDSLLASALKNANVMAKSSITAEDYLKQLNITKEQWYTNNWNLALQKIKGNLILNYIAEKEQLIPSEEEAKQILESILTEAGLDITKIEGPQLVQYATYKKVQDFLLSKIESA